MKSIAFDVDGTLITTGSRPKLRHEVVALMRAYHGLGWKIYVHSGGGVKYAARWVSHFKLADDMPINVVIKGDKKLKYDIMVDDCIEEGEWSKKKHGNYVNAKYFIKV